MTKPVTDIFAPKFPVSVKGVVRIDDEVVLCRNQRDEWELPGGKLEPGEDPEACVRREVSEETGLEVGEVTIVDCWLYDVRHQVEVLIVVYACRVLAGELRVSFEHTALELFDDEELETLPMPEGYLRSIRRAQRRAM